MVVPTCYGITQGSCTRFQIYVDLQYSKFTSNENSNNTTIEARNIIMIRDYVQMLI